MKTISIKLYIYVKVVHRSQNTFVFFATIIFYLEMNYLHNIKNDF